MDLVGRLRRFATVPSARVAPPAWRSIAGAYRRGDHETVLREAGPAYATLSADPDGAGWRAGPALLAGAVLAGREQFEPAVDALRDGLAVLPGTVVADQVGDGRWHRLLLVDLLMLRGEPGEAEASVDHLLTTPGPIEERLAATRALVHLRIAAGHLESAHQLTNAATDLARRTSSNLAVSLVEADRAVLAAAGGMHEWASHTAQLLGPRLVAGRRSAHALQAAAQAGTLAMASARASADAGDAASAAATASLGQAAAHASGRRLERVRALVATAAAARAAGAAGPAEEYVAAALVEATSLGLPPLVATARAEKAQLTVRLGHLASARPQLERAHAELTHAGLHLEASRIAVATS